MQITIAKTAGFCPGVRAALTKAREQSGRDTVYTYGPLIHNQAVIEELEAKGIVALGLNDRAEITEESRQKIKEGTTVLIRAHGLGKKPTEELHEMGARVVDATCPFVTNIHKIVEKVPSDEGIIILGDRHHPEVEGIIGWCPVEPIVIQNKEEIPAPEQKKYTLVSQTTFREDFFREIVASLTNLGYSLYVYETICRATVEHQTEALELAKASDLMIVVGSNQSANTRSLETLCRHQCQNTYLVSNAEEFKALQLDLSGISRVGITAGASTPDYIIQEVVNHMSDTVSFGELFEENYVKVRTGAVVKAKVAKVTENELVLDLGYKCDAIMSANEFGGTGAPLTEQVQVGDEIEAKVIKKSDCEIVLSRRQFRQSRNNDELKAAMENNTVLCGTVKAVVPDKGLTVDYNGTDIFIPASKVDTHRVEDLNEFMGQEVSFILVESKNRHGSPCGDRRAVVGAERAQKRAQALASIKEGDRIKGEVRSLTTYGAFIDLGGVDGMLHLSEMGWKKYRHPGQFCKVGEEIEVYVKAIDAETGRISLSTRFPGEDPWADAETKYAVGNIVKGTVVRFCDFGAFVELDTDVDGLIHNSQLSNKFIQKAGDLLTIGEEIEAEVIDFDLNQKRISLSLKALEPVEEPAAEETEAAPEA